MSSVGRNFSDSTFFRNWFREQGSAYYFLFRKNLKVTNVQFAELLALIRSHTRLKEKREIFQDLQFLTAPEFRTALRELIDSFPPPLNKERCELIASLYSSILKRQVVIESLFGSCAVYVPPHLEIDLASICAQSGYIHSCGRIVYIRNIGKANKKEVVDALRKYLRKFHKGKDKPFFTVYADEDFSKYDRNKEEYLRDGLNDVKVYVEKFYMDSLRLVGVLKMIQRAFKNRLTISQFRLTADNERRSSTIWLLVDHSVGLELRHRGDERYYICYEQIYMNDSAFYIFDENKPAWLAPTTIPHTLVAAMLNLAGLGRAPRKGAETVLADPFVGAGTTWLEALKFKPLGVKLRCSDKAPIANLLAADNLEFFFSSPEALKELQTLDLGQLRRDKDRVARRRENPEVADGYLWAQRFVRKLEVELKKQKHEGNFSKALTRERIAELREKPIRVRLFFYLLLRTSLLNITASKRVGGNGSDDKQRPDSFGGFVVQAEKLIRQIKLLQIVRQRELETPIGKESLLNKSAVRGFSLFAGRFSLTYSVDFSKSKELLEKARLGINEHGPPDWDLIREYDVLTTLPKANKSHRVSRKVLDVHTLKPNSCDVIVTDPPYGFNTDEDPDALANLYAEALRKMIGALRENGQLVLCLLDRSHTGRRSPFFSHKEIIIQQVLAVADKMRREVIIPAFAVPHQREIFRPPYYWESERALRRAILHFKFRRKS